MKGPASFSRPERFTSNAAEDPAGPPDELVHAVHDRYLLEVIEALGICPFARNSRESGKVVRELIRGGEAAWTLRASVGRVRARALEPHPWEIILLTYPPSDERAQFPEPRRFEAFHRSFRNGLAEAGLDGRYFSVCFHPLAGGTPVCETKPEAFVHVLRRSPDPVIQCVDVQTLERVRRHAQKQAARRAKAGVPRAQRAILTDSELSQDIMHANFARFGRGTGRIRLDKALRAVERLRQSLYAPWPGIGRGLSSKSA
jgi:hypothetical protein